MVTDGPAELHGKGRFPSINRLYIWNRLPRDTFVAVFPKRCPVRSNPQFERHDLVGHLAGGLLALILA